MSHFLPVRDIGFCVAHEPRSPTADVIFIHGLNGHRSLTWTNSSREFWLPWLGRRLPDVRVWTYGYNANIIFGSRDPLDLRASQFLSELLHCRSVRILSDWSHRRLYRYSAKFYRTMVLLRNPLSLWLMVWVESWSNRCTIMLVSLMHLITVAQSMILASEPESEWNDIFLNTAGIVFSGTPHRGSSSANAAAAYFRLIPFVKTPPLIHLLRKDSPLLAQIAEQFSNIWGSRRIFSFCETNPTFGPRTVIHHSSFLRHLSQQLLLSDYPQERCDRKLSRRADIRYPRLRSH